MKDVFAYAFFIANPRAHKKKRLAGEDIKHASKEFMQ